MPKRKANWWPPSILSDPDVLSVDDEGRFVLCKICHVHYAVHGGKKPKPVIMNSNFRTRAWDVHKERTNSHRLQKQQERVQQAKAQAQHQQQQGQATDTQDRPQQQQQQKPSQPEQTQQQSAQGQQMQPSRQSQTQAQSKSIPVLATAQTQTRTQAPPRQVQGQALQIKAPPTRRQSPPRASLQSHSGTQVLQQRRQQQDQEQLEQKQRQQQELEEAKDEGEDQLQAARNSVIERPPSSSPECITAATMSTTSGIHSDGKTKSGKRPAATMPLGPPMQKRRVFWPGSPGSSKQLVAESEAARRAAAHRSERDSTGLADHAKKAVPSEQAVAREQQAVAREQQADSSARWRHMHDDVSRALNAAPRRRQPGPISYTSGELRAAKTLAQTETGDLGSNNSERVAKKLRSLNAEYHASNMRHADGCNMRQADVFDRRSAGYKEYWGTLRDVYTSSGTTTSRGSGPGNLVVYRKSHHRSSPSTRPVEAESKETEADSTTPDDSGSSEDAFKPTLLVHDTSLINAIERLTDVTSKQIANLYQKEATDTREVLVGLASVMTDLRVQHGNAFERMIELQEKHLKVMEGILAIKLRKEATRNARSSCNSNGNTSGSSSGSSSGSCPGDSSNGVDSTSSRVLHPQSG